MAESSGICHNLSVMHELRKNSRFKDFGKFECRQISLIPGVLSNISISGMKVTFDSLDSFDMNIYYETSIRLAKRSGDPIKLLVLPVWRFDGRTGGSSSVQIGFEIQHSLEYDKLSSYIDELSKSDEVEEDEEEQNKTVDVDITVQFSGDENGSQPDDYLLQEECECQFL